MEAAGAELRPISAREFALFQALIHREAGIHLAESKRELLVGRLSRRVRELGLGSFGAYYRQMVEGDGQELVQMLDRICTNETHFFRDQKQFEFLEHVAFPEWRARGAAGFMPRRIRAWSAACSTGEEPFSLAMALLWHFPPSSGWEIEILATDLSTRVLERARAATWPLEKAKGIPSPYLKAFMLRGTLSQDGRIKAGPELRCAVRFQRLNLNDGVYPLQGVFDLVLCRNVLIYFDAEGKARVIRRLMKHVAPQGYFLLGHAESLNGLAEGFRSVGPAAYVLPSGRSLSRHAG